ncbi:hypothetical protein QL285_051044 [Trifolium repens]|nr:hypothetical protein QL285_051044 [Trifolium repens]
MNDGEAISYMQKKFTFLTNRLYALGKPISNEVATNKILRYLSKELQPKGTTIKKANDLNTLNLNTLFEKLEEHHKSPYHWKSVRKG